ncbi:MAG: hypothetical protein O2894_14105 [Planctomycetota bacterium]|nr:hypothetical protein [Planctomycetota bacterium]
MDAPRLPPAVAGRSALPAFLPVEAWARERTASARESAAAQLAAARAEAELVRTDGEAALRQAVLDGEHEALRDVESSTRDRVSRARAEVNTWINRAEESARAAIAAAVDLLCAPPEANG